MSLNESNEILTFLKDSQDSFSALQSIAMRTSGDHQQQAIDTVGEILIDIKNNGDKALRTYTQKFDGYDPDPIEIPESEIIAAWEKTSSTLKEALKISHKRIEEFHKLQIPSDIELKGDFGELLGRRWKAVDSAGIYIPGGKAAYPSTVLMNAIPAKVAGVKNIVMASPGNKEGKINNIVLAAAYLAGITKIFRIGGAQAIGSMAFGTELIPKVNVITGPGNLYVTLAKKLVFGEVAIDSLAGPSEVLIIADNTAEIKHVAADLLAQAEHDPLAASILLTTDLNLAQNIQKEVKRQLNCHPRKEICTKSLKEWGLIVHCQTIEKCVELSNFFAPEHLELLIDSPEHFLDKIVNAGAIFIGPWTPEATGDYLAGPNHTLPTSGAAKFSGALSVETFMKNTSLIRFNQKALNQTSKSIIELANSEGLYSHAKSIEIRIS